MEEEYSEMKEVHGKDTNWEEPRRLFQLHFNMKINMCLNYISMIYYKSFCLFDIQFKLKNIQSTQIINFSLFYKNAQ